MKTVSTLILLAAALPAVSAFAPKSRAPRRTSAFFLSTVTAEGEGDVSDASSSGGAVVPTSKESIEFTAGLMGGVAGLVLFGPVFGAIGAAAANYLARKGEVEVVTSVSNKGIDAFNYVADINAESGALEKAGDFISSSIDKSSPEAKEKIESTLNTVGEKVQEYDVVDVTLKTLGTVGEAMEKVIDAGLQMAEDGGITEKINAAVKESTEKVKELSK